MQTKDIIKLIDQSPKRVDKSQVLDALKKVAEKDLRFLQDSSSEYAVVRIKLP